MSYGRPVHAEAIGVVNNVNRDFETAQNYLSGTLLVFLNGILYKRDAVNGWEETGAKNFRMDEAPQKFDQHTDVVWTYFEQETAAPIGGIPSIPHTQIIKPDIKDVIELRPDNIAITDDIYTPEAATKLLRPKMGSFDLRPRLVGVGVEDVEDYPVDLYNGTEDIIPAYSVVTAHVIKDITVADSDVFATSKVVGIAKADIQAHTYGRVAIYGKSYVRKNSMESWTLGNPIFLSSTPGEASEVLQAGTGHANVRVGYATQEASGASIGEVIIQIGEITILA